MSKTLVDDAVVEPTPAVEPAAVAPVEPVEKPPQVPAPKSSEPAPVVDPTNWEESYKGLQKVVAKKDAEIVKVTSRLDTLTQQFEEVKNTSQLSSQDKTKIEKELGEIKKEAASLKSERDELGTKLSRSEVIMKDFSDLSPLAEYIPEGKTEEEFRENAKKFQTDLTGFTKTAVETTIEGATVLQPVGEEDADLSANKEDELWSIINQTAGVQGKEEEYTKANEELMAILNAKEPEKELSF